MSVANVVGTVEEGDWLGLGSGYGTSQLVKATATVASSVLVPTAATWRNNVSAAATWTNNVSAAATWWLGGTISVPFEAPARDGYPAGGAVVWDKPLVYMAMSNNQNSWRTVSGAPALQGYAFDGIERWS